MRIDLYPAGNDQLIAVQENEDTPGSTAYRFAVARDGGTPTVTLTNVIGADKDIDAAPDTVRKAVERRARESVHIDPPSEQDAVLQRVVMARSLLQPLPDTDADVESSIRDAVAELDSIVLDTLGIEIDDDIRQTGGGR